MIHSHAYLTELTWQVLNEGYLTLVSAQINFGTYDVRILRVAVLEAMLAQSSQHHSGSQKVPGSIPTGGNICC